MYCIVRSESKFAPIAQKAGVSRKTPCAATCGRFKRVPTYPDRNAEERPKLDSYKDYLLERIESREAHMDTGNCALREIQDPRLCRRDHQPAPKRLHY